MRTRFLWSQYVALRRWDPGAPLTTLMSLTGYLVLRRRLQAVCAELWLRTTELRRAGCSARCGA